MKTIHERENVILNRILKVQGQEVAILKEYIEELEMKVKRSDVRLRGFEQDQNTLLPLHHPPPVKRAPTPPFPPKLPPHLAVQGGQKEPEAPVASVSVERQILPLPVSRRAARKRNPQPVTVEALQAQADKLGLCLIGKQAWLVVMLGKKLYILYLLLLLQLNSYLLD